MRAALRRVTAGIPHLLPFIGLFFIISGIVGLVFVQDSLKESQETRSLASIEDGTTEVASLTTTSTDLTALNEQTVVNLGFNTHNVPISELTVVFNIVTDVTDEVELLVPEINGISAESELEVTEDGFLAAVTLTPQGGSFFTSNFQQKFLELHFVPEEIGDFTLNFDAEESVAISADASTDTLQHIPTFTYTIIEENSTTNVNSCNESCTSNADCETGHRCYNLGDESRCRLATNPSSSTCDATDDSEKSQCNEACESNRNCSSGLSCYENRCRNPKNLISASCADPEESQVENQNQSNQNDSTPSNDESTQSPEVQSCNEACTTNAECAVNYRCYQGVCRLAANPSSSSCSASTTKTVSNRYEKGEEKTATNFATATGSAQATQSATPSGTPAPTIQPPSTSPPETEAVPPETTALDTALNMLRNPLQQLPMLVIVAGVGLLILGLIALLFMRRSSNPSGPVQSSTPPSSPTTEPPAKESSMVDRLKHKGITPPQSENNNN